MIIQALSQHYDTLLRDPESGISPPGFSKGKVSHCLVIDSKGRLVNIIDLRITRQNKLVPREMNVPEQLKRTSGISANFMCDHCTYVLGLVRSKNDKIDRVKKCFQSFIQLHERLLEKVKDENVIPLLLFLRNWNAIAAKTHPVLSRHLDDITEGGNLVFKLDGFTDYLHERDAVVQAWQQYEKKRASATWSQCLVSGKMDRIARVHQDIKGVTGTHTSGASLVSFNRKSFESYGKEQSFNAPVSEKVAFSYTTALNYLLSNRKHRIRVGDSTVVFWAERSSGGLEEDLLSALFFPDAISSNKEEAKINNHDRPIRDQRVVTLLRNIFEKIRKGYPVGSELEDVDTETQFYILGLAPNAARIAIRFWHVDTYIRFIEQIGQHYRDLSIDKSFDWEPNFLSITKILRETAPLKDKNRISPLMGGSLMRSILTGAPYPMTLYNSIISRIRADREVNYTRVSAIKACLVRNGRFYNKVNEVDFTMALNENNSNTGYLLGRLFALLEKAQMDANPGIKSTIRDRYFGSASASPGSVFPILLRLAQHHIAKAEYGRYTDKRIEDVISLIDDFPAYLSLEDQGHFVLGYYQQRQALYKRSDNKEVVIND